MQKPSWLKVKAPNHPHYLATRDLVSQLGLHTVCQEAACPNIGECWSQKHATMMIMGPVCTRSCKFCNVQTGKPGPLDHDEPRRVAMAIGYLGLEHVVITSVDRDDLQDGGASHFAACISEIKAISPNTSVEVLTPDFLRKDGAYKIVVDAGPDVYNHNLETVPRLYSQVRPGARYYNSLRLLDNVKKHNPRIITKSGIMVGLGETMEEIYQVMDDLISARVNFLTVGQYLRPTPQHYPIDRYLTPEEFDKIKRIGYTKGFDLVASGPLVRSSYHAKSDFDKIRLSMQNHVALSKEKLINNKEVDLL